MDYATFLPMLALLLAIGAATGVIAGLLGVDGALAAQWQAALDAMPQYPSADFSFVEGAPGSEFNGGAGYFVEAEYGHHPGLTPNGSSTLRLFASLGFELSLLGFGSGTNNLDRLVTHNWRHVSLAPSITAAPENPSLYAVARNTVTLLAEYGARIGISGVEEDTAYNHLLPYGLHSGRGNQFSRIGPSRII